MNLLIVYINACNKEILNGPVMYLSKFIEQVSNIQKSLITKILQNAKRKQSQSQEQDLTCQRIQVQQTMYLMKHVIVLLKLTELAKILVRQILNHQTLMMITLRQKPSNLIGDFGGLVGKVLYPPFTMLVNWISEIISS